MNTIWHKLTIEEVQGTFSKYVDKLERAITGLVQAKERKNNQIIQVNAEMLGLDLYIEKAQKLKGKLQEFVVI